MVDKEELALIVADVLAERQGSFDHLLRRPNSQRSLGHEVLEGRPVAVEGCVVEVGTEPSHGILASPVDEYLPSETDDALVRGTVSVFLELLAVNVDHPPRVPRGPEDVVGEESVPMSSSLFGHLR
jgi:hypothetical protein